MNHVSKHDLLTKHGFIKGQSTTTAIISLVELIIDQLEVGNTTISILLDFSKAFDCLDNAKL